MQLIVVSRFELWFCHEMESMAMIFSDLQLKKLYVNPRDFKGCVMTIKSKMEFKFHVIWKILFPTILSIFYFWSQNLKTFPITFHHAYVQNLFVIFALFVMLKQVKFVVWEGGAGFRDIHSIDRKIHVSIDEKRCAESFFSFFPCSHTVHTKASKSIWKPPTKSGAE